MPKAVIVGAGINGLCTARALHRRGWAVEVVEAGPVPNPQAASWDRHRMFRVHYPEPEMAARMRDALAAWEALWLDLGRSHYVERGTLALSRTAGDWSERTGTALAAVGAPLEQIEVAELSRRFPMLETDGVRFGLWSPQGGALMSDRILEDLVAWLRAAGVAVHPVVPVTAVDPATGVASGPEGNFSGDVTILAAGVGLPRLVPDLAGDLVPHRCTVVYLRPSPAWAAAWTVGPAWVDLGGEEVLWGLPPIGDVPLKLGFGLETRPADPLVERDAGPADICRIVAAYRGRFRDVEAFEPVAAVANFYLAAAEERFVLRGDRRMLVLSADSGHGFKFGPLTGEEVAAAINAGTTAALGRRWAGGPGA